MRSSRGRGAWRGSRGHDAAVLPSIEGRPAVCADQCIEGVHFDGTAAPEAVGGKAILRAFSDLAATAARPVAATLTVAAQGERASDWLRRALTGAAHAAEKYGAELVAGDLARTAGPTVLSVAAIGSLPPGSTPPGRDRVEAGQRIVLTGSVGGSLPSGRHLSPEPRFDAAEELVMHGGATGMMDVSDGLAWDAYRLARASSLGIVLDLDRVPIHPDARRASDTSGRTPLDHALHDGEDHELLASIPASDAALPEGCVIIGSAHAGSGLQLRHGGRTRPWLPGEGGWTHGSHWSGAGR